MSLAQAELDGRTTTDQPKDPPKDQPKALPAEKPTDPIISLDKDDQAIEQTKCALSPGYFIDTYCFIDDPNRSGNEWFPFHLWPAQKKSIKLIHKHDKLIILKARQLGITWLCIGYALWLMIFKPGSMILLFSKTSEDARELMRRLAGMWELLPDWMRDSAEKQLEQQLVLKNKSRAKSFTTTKHSGRSFTASFVLIDEAAFIPFFSQLLNAAEETADAGGKLAVISTNDKEKPNNGFADLYKRAAKGASDFISLFIPWYGRPSRTDEWYEHKVKTKRQDDLWQEYPEIPTQALVGLSSNKRFHSDWIAAATRKGHKLTKSGRRSLPRIPGIVYWEQVQLRRPYLIVLDPAEGDATSDSSALSIWDALLWEEVAFAQGKWEPSTLASYAYRLAHAFNNAIICTERNNHGHSVNLSLRDVYQYRGIYKNPFDKKLGWLTGPRTKTLAMDKLAELMELGEIGIRSKEILAQLANIEAGTQAAPEGDNDDAAMCAVIAAAALTWTSIARNSRRRRLASISM